MPSRATLDALICVFHTAFEFRFVIYCQRRPLCNGSCVRLRLTQTNAFLSAALLCSGAS